MPNWGSRIKGFGGGGLWGGPWSGTTGGNTAPSTWNTNWANPYEKPIRGGGDEYGYGANVPPLDKPIFGYGGETPSTRTGLPFGVPPMDTRQGLTPLFPSPAQPVTPPVQSVSGAGNWGGGQPRFELWNPQGGYGALQGLSWDPNFKVNIPLVNPNDPTSESKIQSANYLNWFNQILPMLSPADRATYGQQVEMSLDSLDDPAAVAYFRDMLRAGANAKEGQWNTTGTDYGDRDRLREILRATTGAPTDLNGTPSDLSNQEKWSQDMIDLLTTLVGGGGGPGGMNTQGVWSQDRPMSRQERRDFWNRANTYADSHPDDPFAATLMSLLSPTVSTPQLTTAIGGPAQNTRGSSTKYAYGNQGYY